MRIISKVLIAAAIFYLAACSSKSVDKPVIMGQAFPYTKITLADGSTQMFGEYKGKMLAMIFWATWCSKSQQAVGRFNDFAASYPRSRGTAFIAVNIDTLENVDRWRERAEGGSLNSLIHSYSGNDIADEAYVTLQGTELPYFVVMDRSGKVVLQTHDDEQVYKLLMPASILKN